MTNVHVDEAPHARILLSVSDVAAELGCGRDTVYGLLGSGRLPSVLIGERLRRVRRPDLEQYIAGLPTSAPSHRS
ncbi:helix-turn-helix transcriptional regulator [Cellulomonas sp. P5_C5]